MKDLYQEILSQLTAPGQMFETKEVVNELGVTYSDISIFLIALEVI